MGYGFEKCEIGEWHMHKVDGVQMNGWVSNLFSQRVWKNVVIVHKLNGMQMRASFIVGASTCWINVSSSSGNIANL